MKGKGKIQLSQILTLTTLCVLTVLILLNLKREHVIAKFNPSAAPTKLQNMLNSVVAVQLKASHDYVPDILLCEKKNLISPQEKQDFKIKPRKAYFQIHKLSVVCNGVPESLAGVTKRAKVFSFSFS